MELLTFCESLKAEADSVAALVVERWQEIGLSEPWLALPEDLDHDHLPELIRLLADAALCNDFDRELCRKVVLAAAQHGYYRAEQGFGENLIHREYHLLRRALADRLAHRHGERALTYLAMMRLDALASLSSSAALHGLFKDRLVEDGRWPDVLDTLLDEWPLPRE